MRLKTSATLLLVIACTAWAQLAPPPLVTPNGPAPVITQGTVISFDGSVPQGQVSEIQLSLSLRDAIQRGLRYNLGVLTNRDMADAVKSERHRTLSALLPNLSIGATQTSQQLDLAAFGFNFQGVPTVVGPFGYQNIRAYASQTVYDRASRKNLQSASESVKAADLTATEARNLVVQAVSNAYLAVISDSARVDAIQAEVDTAKALYDRAVDEKQAGTIPGIDLLRAEVELRTEQQRLVAQKNQVEKDKLTLARAIGLPNGQRYTINDTLPFAPVQTAVDDLLKQAYEKRPDIRAAEANLRAAQLAIDSAHAEHYWPSVAVQADYGDVGKTLNNSHGTYDFIVGARFPIYAGGRAHADSEEAEAVFRNRKNALDDLRGRVDYEVRNALLDLQSAADQVTVAQTNVDLANQTLTQARDRFTAGVTDTIEVVQAQQLLASANENYISSLSAHNSAKIALATALGVAEEGVPQYLNLKP